MLNIKWKCTLPGIGNSLDTNFLFLKIIFLRLKSSYGKQTFGYLIKPKLKFTFEKDQNVTNFTLMYRP